MANPNPSPATRFGPGNNANPGGRPRGRSVGRILRELRDETRLEGVDVPAGMTLGDLLARRIFEWALEGDVRFVQIYLERTEGAVRHVPDDAGEARPRLTAPRRDDRFEPIDPG